MSSPLLSLPGEIREKILRFLLGDKGEGIVVFRHAVSSLAEPNRIARAGLNGNYSANHEFEYHNNGPIRHSACIPDLCSRRDWRLDLSVLRVSRQLYEEANHILWTTNAFFFSESRSLPAFMNTLNPAQKRKLTHIQISVIVVQDNISKHFEPSSWSLGVKGSYINLLRDIKELDLFIHFKLKPSSKRPQDMISCSPSNSLAAFEGLRALPLKAAIVIITGSIEDPHPQSWLSKPLDPAEKHNLAQVFRAKLLDPAGAGAVEAIIHQKKLDARRHFLRKDADRIMAYAQKFQDKTNQLVQRANKLETQISRLTSHIEKEASCNEPISPVWETFLQDLRDDGMKAREEADEAVGRAKLLWDEANAKQAAVDNHW
ncbi:MAG: hypothetical protein Q9164_002780 [Protoblastenia rupestris]